jgi:ATP-binding cassette, subfamily B, bacterial
MRVPLKRYGILLAKYLKPQRGWFSLLAFLLFSSIGLQVFIPQVTRSFIDIASTGQFGEALLTPAVAFLVLALVAQGVSVSASYIGEKVAWAATNNLRADLMAHCLQLDIPFHTSHTPGELIERIDSDVAKLANFFSQLMLQVLGNVLLTAGILLVLFWEDWRLGMAFSAFSLTVFYMLNRVRNVAVPAEKRLRQANADLSSFLEERLVGAEDIRTSGAQGYILGRLKDLHQVILRKWLEVSRKQVVIGIVIGLALTCGYAIAFVLGYNLYTVGLISIGTAYLIMNYMLLLNKPFFELAQQIDNLQSLSASVERIEELLEVRPLLIGGTKTEIGKGALQLTFEDVSFRYTPDQPILNNISLSLDSGDVLGVVGRTGSGKTTLTRLIVRLYDIQHGKIRLNGIDVQDLDLRVLRDRIGVVTQDVQLFEATLRDNITLFNPAISDEQILTVMEALGLKDWLFTQPSGLNTQIQAGGRNLSAGEAQLLAFARVFLRNPGLVILDEASSRLDPATEKRIEHAIDILLKDRTAIIVAHRLNTLTRVNKIAVMETGTIIEYGDRAELVAEPTSCFYRLLHTTWQGSVE